MNDLTYTIEIAKTSKEGISIAALNKSNGEWLLISLNKSRAEEILKEFNGNYEKMTESLQITN